MEEVVIRAHPRNGQVKRYVENEKNRPGPGDCSNLPVVRLGVFSAKF